MACEHCRNGFLENKFGQDVECVNGVLIDIDVAHEGWQRDVDYPVAPCHPMWERQQVGDEDFPNDSQERLNSWSEEAAAPASDDRKLWHSILRKCHKNAEKGKGVRLSFEETVLMRHMFEEGVDAE